MFWWVVLVWGIGCALIALWPDRKGYQEQQPWTLADYLKAAWVYGGMLVLVVVWP